MVQLIINKTLIPSFFFGAGGGGGADKKNKISHLFVELPDFFRGTPDFPLSGVGRFEKGDPGKQTG